MDIYGLRENLEKNEETIMSEIKLKQIFSNVFELSDDASIDSLEYRSIPLWDSIGHMALIAAIDQEFDVMLDTQDIIDMSSYKKTKEILSNYGVNFS